MGTSALDKVVDITVFKSKSTTQNRRGRDIPWLKAVRFHKEIVSRAEKSFFSLPMKDSNSDRWTSLADFDPINLSGPWLVPVQQLISDDFRLNAFQGQFESVFIGGPCYLGWERAQGAGDWIPQWRPLFYREVKILQNGDTVQLLPSQGRWSVSPLFFQLLDQIEIKPSGNLDDFAQELIEETFKGTDRSDSSAKMIMKTLFRSVPGLEEHLADKNQAQRLKRQPSPWILFAPTTSVSALTRHLKSDYDRLESLLSANANDIGGLGLLEDRAMRKLTSVPFDVAPFVPLNDPQQRAVQRILSGDPLVVISGPPGTGKSQVVVAVLLNAWAQGKTVLFASNNNKAVDVIRERIERFEAEFPIAVRAGSREKQNIQDVLRRTLNMVAASETIKTESASRTGGDNRTRLLGERQRLLDALAEGIPQRIEEAKRAALQSYAEHEETLADAASQLGEAEKIKQDLGLKDLSQVEIERRLSATNAWLTRINAIKSLSASDDRQRAEINRSILLQEKSRREASSVVGLTDTQAGDWSWIHGGLNLESLIDWEIRFRAYVTSAIDHLLEEVTYPPGIDRWKDANEASEWAAKSRALGGDIRRLVAETSQKLEDVNTLTALVEVKRKRLSELDISQDIQLDANDLKTWLACHVEALTYLPRSVDWLPWSRKAVVEKQLRAIEVRLKAGLSLATWVRIGQLDKTGRAALAPYVETALQWIGLREKWTVAKKLVKEIELNFQSLRGEIGALKYIQMPNSMDGSLWITTATQCDELAKEADNAASSWRQRIKSDQARERLQNFSREGLQLGAGVPIRIAWSADMGKNFEIALLRLVQQPNASSLATAREAIYSGAWSTFKQAVTETSQSTQQIATLQRDLRLVPDALTRIQEWWLERPSEALVLETYDFVDWPELEEANRYLKKIEDWVSSQHELTSVVIPTILDAAQHAAERAAEKLQLALEAVPPTGARLALAAVVDNILSEPNRPWPIAEITNAFSAFSPERIKARIEKISADLERGTFEEAKQSWLKRLANDDATIQAVDALERSIRQRRGEVVVEMYDTFRTALKAVPIWITTAQAAQAIPLESELFDLVVIDEASQCTLTNLLPLVYRAKSLAVIGDEHQLPAIPTIQLAEELSLAAKFELEEFLGWIGHSGVNVYSAAVESLPRRRADVLLLSEHFRSHPLIIGFSNRHIYHQRLELKKNPNWGEGLPLGSGVHAITVTGVAERGKRGRSWLNPIEGQRVLELIKELKSGPSKHLSIGVVTPFAAHKEWLRKNIEPLGFASDVLIDTAYGFQGDERDVIIFSTVVARGMTGSASKWVESPPNLVNVALTRAREALYVVSDFDQCMQEDGILRKLAQYCRDIQLLRDTSPAELELFSWMTVKGWLPKIHPRIADIEVDFVLLQRDREPIAIEVDGREYHEEAAEADRARDAFLSANGYQVLRIPARDVLQTPFDVIHRIGQLVYEGE